MSRMVDCIKLHKQAEGLDSAPLPGALGQRILESVSKEAWQAWITHQTMLINEYRLSMIDPKARTFLKEELEKYFFGEGSDVPQGFVEKNNAASR